MTDAPRHSAQILTIDIYSDVVCPWCAIGYAQLTRALVELEGEIAAQVRWRPFELNPGMAPEGEGFEEHLSRKYGRSAEEGAAMRGQMKAIAQEAGISLSYEGNLEDGAEPPPQRLWNTRDCHKLLAFALQEAGPAAQTALKLALFRAHFNQRVPLNDRAALLDIAAGAGLHREAAKAALDDPALEARVIAEEQQAWDLNITGVPAMIVAGDSGGNFMIPGAQSPQTYVGALRRVAARIGPPH